MAETLAMTAFTVGSYSVSYGAVLTAATAAYSMAQSQKASAQQEYAMDAAQEGVKEQQYIEDLKSKEESNIRRERLLTALATQTAGAGASGVRGSTVEQLQLKSMDDYRRDQLQADAIGASISKGFDRQRESLKFRAESAKYQGVANMAMTLASTGFSMDGISKTAPSGVGSAAQKLTTSAGTISPGTNFMKRGTTFSYL
tara:strand:+ start:17167 stop:17766 length:600 start_codon:yes stop_codon:yes gene_type:complete